MMKVICNDRLCGKKCVLGCLVNGKASLCCYCNRNVCFIGIDVVEIVSYICMGVKNES